jgi:multidrug efflux pump
VEITKTLAETVLIVSLVVFLFLGSLRHAAVPLVAVPISILGAGALMALMGMSLNTLTLLAIVLSIGLVVDDAIVVVENVQRLMREGKSKTEAALVSIRQLAAPLFAMTITLALVYAPIGFISGLSGVMLREFAFTLACAVLVSGLVALTLSPVMSGWAGAGQVRDNRVTRTVEKVTERVTDAYRKALQAALAARWPILSVALFLTLLIPVLFVNSARELAPLEDQSEIDFVGSGSAASTVEYMGAGHIDTLMKKVENLPGGDYVWYLAQPQSVMAALMMVPWDERDVSPQELLGPTYAAISEIPGMQVFPLLPPSLPSGGYFDVEMVVAANVSHSELNEEAGKLMAAAMQTGKFLFVDTDIKIDMPVSRIEIDRDKVAKLDLDLADVGQALGTMVGGNYVNRFDYQGRPYKVIPQVEQSARMSNQDLLNLTIRTPHGTSIPLSSVARIVDGVEPRSLNRFQQSDSFRITGGVAPGVTKDTALTALEEVAAASLPPGYRIDYAGESRQIRKQGNDIIWMGLLGLTLIYLVLLLQFGNFRDPLVVLLGSVPLGLSGALMFTYFDVTTINLYSQVGLVTMVGLIAKNGILIVQFANRQRDTGMSRLAAVCEASVSRLRPVLMTTFATIAGHLPLVFVSGPGAGARNSIGLMLVSGMAIGTLFTLFVLPCVYSVLAQRLRAQEAEPVSQMGNHTPITA